MFSKFIVLLLITHLPITVCDYVTNRSVELHQILFEIYQRNDRPQLSSGPVEVFISFYLTTLIGLNELEGEMTTVGVLKVSWFDDRLVWDPKTFANITDIVTAANQVILLVVL